jgi:LytS/YehU family sensor histidine kinase
MIFGESAMEIILADISVLVTAAFALTLVPSLRDPERSILSTRDKGTVLLVFLVLGLVEEITASQSGWMNARIVAVCAAGLVAGPWVGFIVGIFVSWLAVAYDGLPLGSIAISMLAAGLLGGWFYRWRRHRAQRPTSGFCLALGISLLRNGLVFLLTPEPGTHPQKLLQMGIAPVLQGLGTALILAIVQQARDLDEKTRAAASAEARALQARMNPHFLFNALNSVAALSRISAREVPRATGLLRDFLRASFDQHERLLVSLKEELSVVRAYLDIELLRFGERIKFEQRVDPGLLKIRVPPFSLQPLIENAIQHGLLSSPPGQRLELIARPAGDWLEMSVRDDGRGVPSADIEKLFFAGEPRVHALVLLRRRLQGIFGDAFRIQVTSEVGKGTTVMIRIPLRKQPRAETESAFAPGFRRWIHGLQKDRPAMAIQSEVPIPSRRSTTIFSKPLGRLGGCDPTSSRGRGTMSDREVRSLP